MGHKWRGERLSLLPAKQYIKSNAFLIVCSYDNLESYEKLIEWIIFIRTQREKSNNIFVNRTLNTTIVIINKSDIKNKQNSFGAPPLRFIFSLNFM